MMAASVDIPLVLCHAWFAVTPPLKQAQRPDIRDAREWA